MGTRSNNMDVHKLNGLWRQTKTCYQGDWLIEVEAVAVLNQCPNPSRY